MGLLELKNVTLKLDGKPILNDLSIDFWEGHVHAVVGPNGAGKSTLANTVMGLSGYTDFEGDLLFDGASLRGVPVDERARRGISLSWQEPARFQGVSVRTFIKAAARDKTDATVKRCLEAVGLEPARYLKRAVDKTLSGGERKRVEVASILAMQPRLVLLDEPDSGIDVAALDYIFAAIDLLKKNGSTVVVITHSATVLKHVEHAFLLCFGRLIDQGSVDKIQTYFENKCLPCDQPGEVELGSW